MTHNFSTSLVVRKPVRETEGGVVATQHHKGARAGAEVLKAGGNAIDAAVATAFAMGVVEPWMSGPGGGGGMVFWNAAEQKCYALNFGMRSPAALDPFDYPLSGQGVASDLFPWPSVVGDRNVRGATAVAVPGMVAGAAAAHQKFGTMKWADLLAPAETLAREGMEVDWYASLLIASSARNIGGDKDLARMFLTDGVYAPVAGWTASGLPRIAMDGMADTLATLAKDGRDAYYKGDIGAAIADDVQGKGGSLSREDLAEYEAQWVTPYGFDRGGAKFRLLPGLTAGPTFGDIFDRLPEPAAKGTPDAAGWVAIAEALKGAYDHRLATMGHDGEIPTREACTTHFSVVDRHGNIVAWTQTLLSIFGACTLSQSTGMMMNNGIMWFDPEQGKPNSIAPGVPCLMNICPAIAITEDGGYGFGASGGRKIVGAVSQLAHFVTDRGMSLEEAFHHPRIDYATSTIVADEAIPDEARAALRAGHSVNDRPRNVYPLNWACTSGVMRTGGMNAGCTEVTTPWGDAVREEDV
ncbi:gamma-glutamyltransferase [Oceanicola sp. 22II-s10i]|uniref:gamma-glutamyltransferase n=1 Tax=Oceanicola sp. 22II-s10i TaxID=1317116 RepID=UPI000B5264C3|nr:gamma-glutamyltransferase [Oceanicola sp. 22II-s10i]OWU85628.1 gamma-glutamyltransferase [Oceanicola sp. 22II-s10i]